MKVMGFITQGAHLFGGQELALSYMISHALLMRCIPVPGDLPNSYVGAAGWTRGQSDRHSLKEFHDRCDRDAVMAVEAARQVARRSVEMAMIVREGLRANQRSLANYPDYRFVLDRLSDEVPQQGPPLG